MVKGLDVFKKYFNDFPQNYVVIGGTACDIILEEAELIPRATKDIDIILVVEALTSGFLEQFWQFIRDGKYERKERSEDGRQYYRFAKPEDNSFPYQIELFSRIPDIIHLQAGTHLTPIPAQDDFSSLSAILMDEDYYNYIIEHSTDENGLNRANTEALICLKAKAFLEISLRIANGSTEDKKQLKKHKADVFRMAIMMKTDELHDLPIPIRNDMLDFMQMVVDDLPDKTIFKEMGAGTIDVKSIYGRLIVAFGLQL